MTKAPNRFTLVDRHLSEGGGGYMEPDYQGEWMLYEDLPALLAAEREKALREAAHECEQVAYSGKYQQDDQSELGCLRCRDNILALIDTNTEEAK